MNSLVSIERSREFFPADKLLNISATSSVGDHCTATDTYTDYLRFWQTSPLQPGHVVVIALPNTIDVLHMFFAVLNSGLVPALIAPTTPAERFGQIIEDFQAAALVKSSLRIDGIPHGPGARAELIGRWSVLIFDAPRMPSTRPGEVIITTSGTSASFSSGCVHRFESLQANGLRHAHSIGLRKEDRVLVNLPLYYSTALVAQAIATLTLDAQLVISGPPFLLPQYTRDIAAHRITVSSLTPVLLRQINACEPSGLPPGLRVLSVGGDHVPAEQVQHCLQANPQLELYLTYGITEAGPRVSTLAAHRVDPARYASVGLPLAGTQVRLDWLSESPWQGELLVSSNTLLLSKIGRSAKSPLVDIDGTTWLRTGDIFTQDAQGYLFFKGRKSDFLVINDEKVNLGAIKHICRTLPGVISCRTLVKPTHQPLAGFELEVTLDQSIVPSCDGPSFKQHILKLLKRYERPGRIDLVFQDAGSIVNYK